MPKAILDDGFPPPQEMSPKSCGERINNSIYGVLPEAIEVNPLSAVLAACKKCGYRQFCSAKATLEAIMKSASTAQDGLKPTLGPDGVGRGTHKDSPAGTVSQGRIAPRSRNLS